MTKRILIAAADDDLRQALAQLLELEGYHITGTHHGSIAVGLAQQLGYDLILLDAKMPGTNGLDVLATLRRLLPTVPIIMMSGQSSGYTVSKALRGGASDFMLKPFDDEFVLLTVKRALSGQT
jgi:DNA-binding response OmpR family regulator